MAHSGGALYDPRPGAGTGKRIVGFFSNLLAFIFLEKKARDKLARRQAGRPASGGAKARQGVAPGKRPAVDAGGHAMTPERERIIAEAMKIVEQKQDVLADLSEEERQDLIDTLTSKDAGKRE